MPNNQDAVKLLPKGYWIEGRSIYKEDEGRIHVARFTTFSNREANQDVVNDFAAAMNAPTPREQELEAQNKALWELIDEADVALRGMVSLITVNTVVGGKIPSIFAEDGRVAWAIEARAAIQKAKEAR